MEANDRPRNEITLPFYSGEFGAGGGFAERVSDLGRSTIRAGASGSFLSCAQTVPQESQR